LSGFDGHQGIALVVAPRRYAEVADILARAIERDEAPFVLVLDSLEDPQNVGTLLRSAEAAATHGVVFPTRHQAPLSPSAIKASAGAVEHLLLAPVDDLPGALADLHVRGLRIVGADADAALTVRDADLRGPLALVVGSEGQGLGPAVRRRCDLLVRIPMRGAVGSLNASVAGSILLYEATTQRGGSAERRMVEPPSAAKPQPASEPPPGEASEGIVTDVELHEPPAEAVERPEDGPVGRPAKAGKSPARKVASKEDAARTAPTKGSKAKSPATAQAAAAKTAKPAATKTAKATKAKTPAAAKAKTPATVKAAKAKTPAAAKASPAKATKAKTPAAAKAAPRKTASPKASPSAGKGLRSDSRAKKTLAKRHEADALLPGGPASDD
jgi:23S rRNA (guanosine2251-2'-O)-methyltransferase